MHRDSARRVVLLTGASTGLGLAITRHLLSTEHHLVLTARESSLSRFAAEGIVENDRIWLRPLDVTSCDQRRSVVAEIEAEFGGVDFLINNAGVAYRTVIEHASDDDHAAQMAVNYHGPIALSRLVLPAMRKRRAGRIIQISSMGGLMSMPTMGLYAASKFALEAATEAMYYEARPFGVGVSLVLPGFIHSDSFQRVLLAARADVALADVADAYHPHYHHMTDFIARIMRLTPATPDTVARTVLRTIHRRWPPLRVPATVDTHLLWWFRRVIPHRLYLEITYRLLPGITTWGKRRA